MTSTVTSRVAVIIDLDTPTAAHNQIDLTGSSAGEVVRPHPLVPTITLRTPAQPLRIVSDTGVEFIETYRHDVTPGSVEAGWAPVDKPDLWFGATTGRAPWTRPAVVAP